MNTFGIYKESGLWIITSPLSSEQATYIWHLGKQWMHRKSDSPMKIKNNDSQRKALPICGVEGTRTPVQTYPPKAFYMLI